MRTCEAQKLLSQISPRSWTSEHNRCCSSNAIFTDCSSEHVVSKLSAARSLFFRAGRPVQKRSALEPRQHRCTSYGKSAAPTCQRSDRQPRRRPARSVDPEALAEQEEVPAWKRVAGFLLKTAAVGALAFALVRPDTLRSPWPGDKVSVTQGHSNCKLHVTLRFLQTFGSVPSAQAAGSAGRMGGSSFGGSSMGSRQEPACVITGLQLRKIRSACSVH